MTFINLSVKADATVEQMCIEDPQNLKKNWSNERLSIGSHTKKREEEEDSTLLSRIAHAKLKSKYLSNDEAVNLTIQIFVAGNETTASLISNLMWRMMTVDNLWEDFVSNKIDINNAINGSLATIHLF